MNRGILTLSLLFLFFWNGVNFCSDSVNKPIAIKAVISPTIIGKTLLYCYDKHDNQIACFLFEDTKKDLINKDKDVLEKYTKFIDLSNLKKVEELSGGCVVDFLDETHYEID